VLIALLLLFPALPGVGSNLIGDANLALQYGLVGMSLVLLIGLVGQISLAQASFVGIGAFVTGLVIDHMHVPFPANTPLAAIASGVCATVLGVVALRVRGLYLAVATLIFAWMCDAYLFQQSWLVGEGGSRAFAVPHVGVDVGFPSFDLSDRRTFYYVALAAAAAIAIGIGLLRRSKTGRAFLAVRGSEVAAASLGINVTRYKLLAFGISGVVAGVAGNLFAVNTGAITTSEFSFTVSLFYLSIAVVGGLTSTGGALAAGVVFSLLNELFFQVDALAGYLDIVSAGLLTAVLLAYPGGLAALPGTLRGPRRRAEMAVVSLSRRLKPVLDHLRPLIAERAGLFRRAHAGAVVVPSATGSSGTASGEALTPKQRLTRLLFATTESTSTPLPSGAETEAAGLVVLPHAMSQPAQTASLAELIAARPSDLVELTVHREDRDPVLAAEHVSMRFGGLLAVDDVSLTVRQGEIVGLIGPNGAGKTTTFNCISGLLVPSAGAVSLFGKDVTRVPVHERAYMGLGRTFQVIQLFPQLTVFDNLLVATHTSNNTGVLAHLGVTKAALLGERQAREWVGQVLEVMGLQPYSDRQVSGLPFGLLRMVELARALVTGARLVMLDEPASGLDNAETERLTDLLLSLRAGLGLTLLLIEHDVRMVTAVSDYIYVLDRGRLLAEGTAHDVQRNSAVIAAYLGEPVGEVVA
jgi:sulfate-transporting ATPase